MRQFNLLLFFLLVYHFGVAQNRFIKKFEINSASADSIIVRLDSAGSSYVLESKWPIEEFKLFLDEDYVELKKDIHSSSASINRSELLITSKLVSKIKLTGLKNKELVLYVLYVPELEIDINRDRKNQNDSCGFPIGIDQDIWRAGLPAPSVNPTFNTVSHCIVHHSAGSNTASDYTEVVRNIYVFHTDVNGWDDIGYNYLIAPDGTLYCGRDGMN